MVIIEGMDNSGKTTLAKRLCEKLNLELVPSTGDTDLTTRHIFHTRMCRQKKPYVIDRTPAISELVYGPPLRGRVRLHDPEMSLHELISSDPVLVYCRPSSQCILDFKSDIPQMAGVIDNAPELLQRYDQLMNFLCTRLTLIQYDFQNSTDGEIVEKVRKSLSEKVRDSPYSKSIRSFLKEFVE